MNKFILLLIIGMLVACQPSPKTIKQVNQLTYIKKDKSTTCINDENHCAIDTPLLELFNKSETLNQQYVSLLEKGEDSLLLRIHMIKAAKKSIDIQTFIG